jgi:hypothetical protein
MATVTSGRALRSDADRCGGQVVQVPAGTEDRGERFCNA